MDEKDLKTLSRIRWERKKWDMSEGRRERAEVFRDVNDYKRKAKYPVNYMEDEDERARDDRSV